MDSDPSAQEPAPIGLNGDSVTLAVDRAVSELKHGRFIGLVDGERALIVASVESTTPAAIVRMRRFAPAAALLLTAERAMALDASTVGPVSISLEALATPEALQCAAGLTDIPAIGRGDLGARPWNGSTELLAAAFALAKIARTVPALIGVETALPLPDRSVTCCELASFERFVRGAVPPLERISAGRIPLLDAEETTVTLFREPFGDTEHIAVTIGQPDLGDSIPVRLHSACLTGDVLGSLRCDCGEQLRTALRRISALGGGILLYLDQEGRGIGLANKLRAYTFQDTGMDTLDADHHLGFRADERTYGAAAAMLSALGIERVRLMTNNPQKIAALRDLGIDVIGRLPLITSTNVHNERYLRAKRERAGHLSEETGS